MLSGVLILLSLLALSAPVQAQTTQAKCVAGFGYLNNTLGQSPCLIGAYLEQACVTDGGNWNIPVLPPGESYTGPSLASASYCTCSSVAYSLIAACAACQDHVTIAWSNWAYNCTESITTVGQWPLDVPSGTAIPAWAYQNVSVHDTFELSIAQNNTAPQSTYFGRPTASINYHLSASVAASTTAVIGTTTPTAAASQSKSNVGPIVGGVVGGLAVLALLGVLIFLCVRQQRSKKHLRSPKLAPEVYYMEDQSKMAQAPYSGTPDYGVGYATSPTIVSSDVPSHKLYDPSDPTTFPMTPASFGYQSTTTGDLAHTAPISHPDTNASGGYSGTAEIQGV